jgi:hypothetical protein
MLSEHELIFVCFDFYSFLVFLHDFICNVEYHSIFLLAGNCSVLV